jgi:hypothetical protein
LTPDFIHKPGANTLAYFVQATTAKEKSFIQLLILGGDGAVDDEVG